MTENHKRGRPLTGGRKATDEFRTRLAPAKGAVLRSLIASVKLQGPDWMAKADGDILIEVLGEFLARQKRSNSGMPLHIAEFKKEFQV